MQHPSRAFLAHPVFESLRRWSHGGLAEADVPLEATIGAMDDAGVRVGLLCAWWGAQGPLIGNDEVVDKFGGLLGYPTSFLISREGKIVKKVQGLISYEEFTKAIESQL